MSFDLGFALSIVPPIAKALGTTLAVDDPELHVRGAARLCAGDHPPLQRADALR